MSAVSLLITPALAKAALKHKKSDGSSKRIEGELPSAPPVAKDVPEWWDETTTVLDRIRTETNKSLDSVKSQVVEVGTQVDNVESQISASNIKKLYEDNEDTNSFTDFYKNRLENLEDALGIEGSAMGTGNEQEIDNKVLGGGSF